jgi:hypothetical protein
MEQRTFRGRQVCVESAPINQEYLDEQNQQHIWA